MRRMFGIAVLAVVLPTLLGEAASAANLALSVVRPAAGQWQVYGLLSNNTDNDGLASLIVNITGTGDLGVATSTCQLPVGVHYWMVGQNLQSKYVGFTEFRSDGTYGIGIRAGQRTTALDQVVLTDVGYSAGSYPGDQTGQGLGPLQITWATPVLIASGTYSGTWGVFTAALGDGQVNVLNQNRDPNAVGQVHKIETVTSGGLQILHPGDAGGDNQVAFSDLSSLATNWGQTNKTWADGDFNEDHTVNFPDLSILAANWGWSAPSPAPVPEPASATVLALGAVALLRRRKS